MLSDSVSFPCCLMACHAPAGHSLLREASRQSSDGDLLSEELEFLQNVYFDEMSYEAGPHDQGGHTLQFRVTPSTGDDKERQFVYLVLNITLPKEYPLAIPECSFVQSRGLSDAHLRSILDGLYQRSEELLGCEMIYQLVEFTKDNLTDNNLPSGECAICLSAFQECEEFKKTDCYHYFHVPCLAGYLEYYQRQLIEDQEEDSKVDVMLRKKARQFECPICRVPMEPSTLTFDPSHKWTAQSLDSSFKPSPELRAWQKKMEELLWKQRQKGGVIDPSQSDVIDPSWVSTISTRNKEDLSATALTENKHKKPLIISKSDNHSKLPSADKCSLRTNRDRNGYFQSDDKGHSKTHQHDKQEGKYHGRSSKPRQRHNTRQRRGEGNSDHIKHSISTRQEKTFKHNPSDYRVANDVEHAPYASELRNYSSLSTATHKTRTHKESAAGQGDPLLEGRPRRPKSSDNGGYRRSREAKGNRGLPEHKERGQSGSKQKDQAASFSELIES